MASLQTSSSPLGFENLKECIRHGESKLRTIPHPEAVYDELLTRAQGRLDGAFGRLYPHTGPDTCIKKEIVQYVKELITLEIDKPNILANAAKSYNSRASAVAQRTYRRLLTIIEPGLSKEAPIARANEDSDDDLVEDASSNAQLPTEHRRIQRRKTREINGLGEVWNSFDMLYTTHAVLTCLTQANRSYGTSSARQGAWHV